MMESLTDEIYQKAKSVNNLKRNYLFQIIAFGVIGKSVFTLIYNSHK